MATHAGTEGTVKLSTNVVAEIIEFEFTQSVEPVDDTAMGDTWETHIAASGHKKWEGSLTCHWDETDSSGQVTLLPGVSVTLNMYPEGATTGDYYYTGTATVVEHTVTTKKDGETIRAQFKFKGNGALTPSTA